MKLHTPLATLALLALAGGSCAFYASDGRRDAPPAGPTPERSGPATSGQPDTAPPAAAPAAERARRQLAVQSARQAEADEADAETPAALIVAGPADLEPPPGVFNGATLFQEDYEAKVEIQEALTADLPDAKTYDCLIALSQRLGRNFTVTWTVQVRIHAENGTGEVVSLVDGPAGHGWPDFFDETAKACIAEALVGVTFEASHDYTYDILFPMCAKGLPE